MKNLKNLSTKLALVCLGGLIGLLLMEGGLRLYGIAGQGDRLSVYEFDDTLGWKTKPNTKYFRSTRDYAHFNYYNPRGFPVAKQDWRKLPSSEAPTIAFIGDSFTEGYYLPYEHTYPYLIDQEFSDKQVVNLGVAAYAPDQYLLSARKHLGDYNATDIVVTFFPFNDLPEISKDTNLGYAKPIFGESLSTPRNTPLKKLRGGVDQGALRWLNDHSAVIRAINPWLFMYVPGLRSFGTSRPEPTYFEESAMRTALRLIKQIEIEFPVETFVVYYVPLYEELLQPELFDQNIELYHELCDELAMGCFTTEKIVGKVSDPSELYLRTDGHFSKRGASLVADHIYEILSRNEPE